MQFETTRYIKANTSKVHRRRALRQTAALRAMTGARLFAAGMVDSIAEAAVSVGSNRANVHAAVTLLKAENRTLVDQVLAGEVSLLRAAKQARRVADLVAAYRAASQADIIQAAKIVGPMLVAAE
jgi:hypothetical protein